MEFHEGGLAIAGRVRLGHQLVERKQRSGEAFGTGSGCLIEWHWDVGVCESDHGILCRVLRVELVGHALIQVNDQPAVGGFVDKHTAFR